MTAGGKAALVIAHPGHELCVYGWLEQARPLVFVLTDGSGRSGASRVGSTTRVLATAGARPASIYGRFTDLEVYAAILRGDFGLFERLVVELAEELVRHDVDYVTGEAAEGYNPVHDACRLVVDAAAELASRKRGRPVVDLEFPLFSRHDALPEERREGAIWLELDDAQFERKLAVARAYPELRGEVGAMFDKAALEALEPFPELKAHFEATVTDSMGTGAFRVECLRLASGRDQLPRAEEDVPFYERYGERLVAAGAYAEAIRYRDHLLPLAEAIRRVVDDRP